jgi:chemotaxis protein methyltransferase CheR
MSTVTTEEIDAVSSLVFDLCGIVLDRSKGYLIEGRLTSVMQTAGVRTFHDLVSGARSAENPDLSRKIVDAITTNETLFFRDASPFEALRHKAIPERIDAKAGTPGAKRLRIWSAACSTGQEPYSIAMVLSELIPDIHHWDITILATDISDAVIKQASAGRYADFEIDRGMTPERREKYFVREAAGWKIRDEIRGLVTFRKLNLLEPFRDLGPFDVIFCRNVAIYFSPADRASLFRRLVERLDDDGYLFVGSSESLIDLGPEFSPHHHCRSTYYQPRAKRLHSISR